MKNGASWTLSTMITPDCPVVLGVADLDREVAGTPAEQRDVTCEIGQLR